jgi:methyl-accepting chemotaxis protein
MNSTTSIKSTLIKGLMLIVFFFLAQGGIVWYATSSAKTVVVENTRKNTAATSELGALAILAQQIRRYEKEYFINIGNKEQRGAYEREWRDAQNKIDAALAKMKSGSGGVFSASDIRQVTAWSDASAFYGSEMNKIFSAVTERSASPQPAVVDAGAGPAKKAAIVGPAKKPAVVRAEPVVAPVAYLPAEVNSMIKAGKDRFSADLIKGVEAMDKAKTADTLALADVAEAIFNKLLLGVLVTVAIGVVIAILLAQRLPKSVMKPIDHLSAAAQEMSMGNLDKAFDSGGVVEFDKLAEALDRLRLGQQMMAERLRRH